MVSNVPTHGQFARLHLVKIGRTEPAQMGQRAMQCGLVTGSERQCGAMACDKKRANVGDVTCAEASSQPVVKHNVVRESDGERLWRRKLKATSTFGTRKRVNEVHIKRDASVVFPFGACAVAHRIGQATVVTQVPLWPIPCGKESSNRAISVLFRYEKIHIVQPAISGMRQPGEQGDALHDAMRNRGVVKQRCCALRRRTNPSVTRSAVKPRFFKFSALGRREKCAAGSEPGAFNVQLSRELRSERSVLFAPRCVGACKGRKEALFDVVRRHE